MKNPSTQHSPKINLFHEVYFMKEITELQLGICTVTLTELKNHLGDWLGKLHRTFQQRLTEEGRKFTQIIGATIPWIEDTDREKEKSRQQMKGLA